ncbi:M4 family metallopeptidase [Archangium primigenium]|uniref:M4 family metallopeptidase n=1 Tax=[Archangium] primigenium TaxID=2792470 RepID=UPI003084112C
MIRHRILAAVLTLPLAACSVDEGHPVPSDPDTPSTLAASEAKAALSVIPGALVLGAHEDGVPFLVRGEFGTLGRSLRGVSAGETPTLLSESLGRIAPVFRLSAADLVFTRAQVDERGHTHARYAQTKNGLPVVGHELVVHVDDTGRVYAANGSARDGESLGRARATLPREDAVRAALGAVEGTRLAAPSARLVYYRAPADGRLQLAYEVVVTGEGPTLPLRDHVFVSAREGVVLGRATEIHAALNRAVYTANNKTTLPGTLKRSEGGAATGDTHIDENYAHLATTYNCFKTNFGRDSYNNAGAQLKSSVHYDTNYTNAFWDGTQMVYGDSDGVEAGPLGKSLDVTVHELTHAVTESSSNLTYAYESGALNEGMSDIFAAYCESWTKGWSLAAPIWMIGDDIWTPNIPNDALRYMGNPTQDGYSTDYYPERYTGYADYGGVHYNSGIANLAFKLLATGGKHPRDKTTTSVPGLGMQKAGAIFYRANTLYMTASTTFAQAKAYTVQAATDLNHDPAAVIAAWDAVGVGGTTTPPCSSTLTLSNGTAVQGIAVGTGDWSCTYRLTVPAGMASLSFDMSGGTGDADLYVKYGAVPNESAYDCRPFWGGSTENCTFTSPPAGIYYVKIYGYSEASGVSLKGTYGSGGTGGGSDGGTDGGGSDGGTGDGGTDGGSDGGTGDGGTDGGGSDGGTGGGVTMLANGVETAMYAGATNSWRCFSVTVPSGRSQLTFTQTGKSGATGDGDLYVKYGAVPGEYSYDCRPYAVGSTETCTTQGPAAGTWYACTNAFTAFTNVTMKATW